MQDFNRKSLTFQCHRLYKVLWVVMTKPESVERVLSAATDLSIESFRKLNSASFSETRTVSIHVTDSNFGHG